MTISILCFSAGAARAEPLNVVSNGSFEEVDQQGWANGWKQWPETRPPGSSVGIDANVAHTGVRSLRISHQDQNSYSRADQIVPVTPGKQYMISCWVRGKDLEPAPGAGGALLFIGRNGTGNSFRSLGPGRTVKGTFPWTRYEIGPVEVDDQTKLAVLPYLHKTSGTVWYDDIEIVQLTPDLGKRIAQMRTRNILLRDIALVEAACRKGRAEKEARRAAAMRKTVSARNDLPTDLNRRKGPPFFALHRDIYRILATALHNRFPNRDLAATLADPFARQPHLDWPSESATDLTADIHAMRNDVEQVVLNLTNTTPQDIDATLSLIGPLSRVTTVWREVVPVELREGIFIDDALPRARTTQGRAHVTIPSGMTRQVWLQVRTGDTPGNVPGKIHVRWPSGSVDVMVNVVAHNLTFPEEWPIHTFGYAYLAIRPLTRDRVAIAASDLVRHHTNAIMPHGWAEGVPAAVFAKDGTLRADAMDWSAFDTMLRVSAYARTFILAIPPNRLTKMLTIGQETSAFGGPIWEKRAIAWVHAVQNGLRRRGIGREQVLWTSVDEPSGGNIDTAVVIGRMLHRADPRIRVYSNFYEAATPEDVRKLDAVVDVWAPSIGCLDDTYLPICRTRGRELWAYRVQGKGTPPAGVRGAFWRLFSAGVRGYSFWTYAGASVDPWDPYDTDQHDYAVVYNGDPDEMIPSKRWEAWREGVEDYTLLWMLARKKSRSQAASASADSALPAITEHSDAREIRQARNRVLQALTSQP